MKRFFAVIISLLLTFCLTVNAENAEITISSECDISDVSVPIETETVNSVIGQKLEIKAKSSILMEPNTMQILYEDNADEVLPPASITKIMTLLLVMEALDRGDISFETTVNASEHACSMGGSQIWLEPNEAMTVDELLKATVIASANDACVALGELIAGSEEGFVALMNERAKELGMNNTTFMNCTGLDAEGHVTSAHDVAVMSCELVKHELIKEYSTVWMDTLRDGKSELVNTNKLVRFYEGTTGLKTGTTDSAKYCLSASAKRNGMELVAVVMAGQTSNDRFNGAKKLLDYGFSNYSFSKIEATLDFESVKVNKGVKKDVKIYTDDKISVLLPKTSKDQIKKEVSLNEITAPIKKGSVIGNVTVYVGEEEVGKIDIKTCETVEKITPLITAGWILKGVFKL